MLLTIVELQMQYGSSDLMIYILGTWGNRMINESTSQQPVPRHILSQI